MLSPQNKDRLFKYRKNNIMENVKIGLMGVGLNTYWEQFEGLLDRLIGYQNKIKNKMQSLGNVTVIDAGMVDDSEKADRVTSLMKSEDVEILFIYISTYALSSTIIPIANRLNIPVILFLILRKKSATLLLRQALIFSIAQIIILWIKALRAL